jgi:PAS domain S-box-containing protein
MAKPKRPDRLLAENAALRLRLEEAEETLRAIGNGEVDAFVVAGPLGKQIFTLKGAEHPYRVLVETMSEGAATLAADGTILYCNESLASLLQIPLAGLIGKKISSFVAARDQSVFSHRLESGAPEHGSDEILLLSQAGPAVPVLLSSRSTELSGIRSTSVILTDLTQQKRNEAIIASEGLARSIIEQAGEAIFVCDEKGEVIRASRIAHQLCRENPLRKNFDRLFQPGIQGKAALFSVLPSLSGANIQNVELEYRRGSDQSQHLILNATPLHDSRNQIIGCVVTLTDITERKKSERLLQTTLQRFYQMFASMYSGVLLMTEEGRVEFVNQAFCDAYGLTDAPSDLAGLASGELLQRILPAFLHPEKALARIEEILRRAEPVRVEEFSLQGGRRALRDFTPLIVGGKPCGRFWIYTDITELRRAEKAQLDSDLRFRLATEATGVGIWEWNLLTNRVRWDNQMFRIYGMSPTEGGYLQYGDWSGSVLPEDLPRQEEMLREMALRGGSSSREFRIRRREDGECRVIRSVETVRSNDRGVVQWIVGTNFDITEREQAMEVKAALAAIVENSEDAIIGKNLDGTITSWNAAAERLFGYREEETIGQPVTLIIPPELQAEESDILEQLRKGRGITHFETVRLGKGGNRLQVSLTISAVRNASGTLTGASKIARDIGQRKRTEEALKDSEARFRTMADAIPQLAWTARADGHLFWYNERWYDYTGTRPEQMEGWGWQSVHDPAALPKVLERWLACIATGEPFEMTFPLLGADGVFRPFLTRVIPLKDAAGRVTQWFGTNTDVDELKRVEDALRRAEAKARLHASDLEAIMDAMPAITFIAHDPDCRSMTSNPAAYRLLRLAPRANTSLSAPEEELPATFRPLKDGRELTPEELPVQQAAATGQAINDCELTLAFKDGSRSIIYGNAVPLFDETGKPRGAVGSFLDITELKLAEERTQAQLAEKEVMLREIHHRVKNNLQVISSLVSLQADTLVDPRMRAQLNEVRDRVRSMALVHEKLYQTADLAQLDFADYAASLMQSLWRSHGAPAEKVRLDLAVTPVTLPIEAAIPCGLILNELASNALKHGFPDGRAGQVTVGLSYNPETREVCLLVRDNGVGLAPGLEWRQSRSLGLRLVQLLAGQLRGTVATGSGPGAEFKVVFVSKGSPP